MNKLHAGARDSSLHLVAIPVAVPVKRGEVHARWTCLMQTMEPFHGG